MIYDHLREQRRYRAVHPGLDLAFDFLLQLDPGVAEGRYELDGKRVVATIRSYETKPASVKKYEAHLRYLDLQYVISGEESIYHTPLDRLTLSDAYDEEKDCAFYLGEDSHALTMKAGEFSILFPHDGHKPGCNLHQESVVKKVVVKIAI